MNDKMKIQTFGNLCYLRDPEAVEILQKFEGVVQLTLGQMLCHDGQTNRNRAGKPARIYS